jgi:hypothetical protein
MRHARRIATGLLALAILGPTLSADQPKPDEKIDPKAIDTALYNTLREVINKGADMYNSGDMTGCYRLFEGALLTARPMLAHRPELQKSIAKALASADRDPVTFRRAFALRASLDKIRVELNPNPKKDVKLPPPFVEEKKEKKTQPDPVPEVKKTVPEVKKPIPEVKKPDPEPVKPAPEVKKIVPEVKKTVPEVKKDDGKDEIVEKLPLPKIEPDDK